MSAVSACPPDLAIKRRSVPVIQARASIRGQPRARALTPTSPPHSPRLWRRVSDLFLLSDVWRFLRAVFLKHRLRCVVCKKKMFTSKIKGWVELTKAVNVKSNFMQTRAVLLEIWSVRSNFSSERKLCIVRTTVLILSALETRATENREWRRVLLARKQTKEFSLKENLRKNCLSARRKAILHAHNEMSD